MTYLEPDDLGPPDMPAIAEALGLPYDEGPPPLDDNDAPPDDGVRRPRPPRVALPAVHDMFRTWLGPKYDLQFLDVVLAVAAAGLHLPGDPAWLQCVGGPGVGKTETLMSLSGSGAHVVSTITGEAALLSATPTKSRAKNATGGLLRQVGSHGLIVVKDFTSILSMNRDARASVLASLREVHDGQWTRNAGTDGGLTITWRGRVAVISGVTSAYDEHHSVIAAMGDRFLVLRLASEDEEVRIHATRQALTNSGGEDAMRGQLSMVVAGLLGNLQAPAEPVPVPEGLADELVTLADIVTRARSEVAKDWQGTPEYAHAPEMPTRLAKQLLQSWRGARLIGLPDENARLIARRLAHDSIPPGRRVVLLDVIEHPGTRLSAVARRTGLARNTADRRLIELTMHKLIAKTETGDGAGWLYEAPAKVAEAAHILRVGYGLGGGYDPAPRGGVSGKGGIPRERAAEADSRSESPSLTPLTPCDEFSGHNLGGSDEQ